MSVILAWHVLGFTGGFLFAALIRGLYKNDPMALGFVVAVAIICWVIAILWAVDTVIGR